MDGKEKDSGLFKEPFQSVYFSKVDEKFSIELFLIMFEIQSPENVS